AAGTSQADATTPCDTLATPNATIDLNTIASLQGTVTSPDGGYICVGCKRFVVDVKLPTKSANAIRQLDGTFVEALDTKSKCEAAQLTVHWWRKPAGATAFTTAGGGTTRGNWTNNACTMTPTTGYTATTYYYSTGSAAGDTWRVAVGGVIHTVPAQVK